MGVRREGVAAELEASVTEPLADLAAEDFLELVWGARKGWVDLPAKVGGFWVPYHLLWDGNGASLSVTRRIDSCLRDGENLYFSVGQFRKKGRNYEDFMPTSWLWADLDEIHPTEAVEMGIGPTLAWQSSRGRYQALWRLDRKLGADTLERLNQALSYKLGADRGGWDLTQVLRVPGTRNFKYSEAPLVSLLWYDDSTSYDPKRVWRVVRDAAPTVGEMGVVVAGGQSPAPRRSMPARARSLLRVPADSVVEGERSDRLWELECLLAESGWSEDEIHGVVSESAWNKWSSVRTGEERLRREIRKAIRHVLTRGSAARSSAGEVHGPASSNGSSLSSKEDLSAGVGGQDDGDDVASADVAGEDSLEEADRFAEAPFDVRYASFMAMEMEAPRWMIEGLWTEGAHGILGGEPKTLKTTLALAMGLAVASGKPFLGEFPVHAPGPVLMVQEENAPWNIQDRMRKIASSYGLISSRETSFSSPAEGSIASTNVSLEFPADIPFHLANNVGMDLGQEEWRERLEWRIKELRPKLLILDPLKDMFGDANFDKLHEVNPYLKWLRVLRFEYDVGILLVHHTRKASAERPGQRLLGSTAFHGWTASALYCQHLGEEDDEHGWKHVAIEREFREQAPQKALKLSLRLGEPGSLDFQSIVQGWNAGDQVLDFVLEAGGKVAMTTAMKELDLKRKALYRRVHGHERLAFAGRVGKGNVQYIVLTDEDGNYEGQDA